MNRTPKSDQADEVALWLYRISSCNYRSHCSLAHNNFYEREMGIAFQMKQHSLLSKKKNVPDQDQRQHSESQFYLDPEWV